MGYLHTDQTADRRSSALFDDQIISDPLGLDAALGYVTAVSHELGSRRYGASEAMDGTIEDFSDRPSLSHIMPAWLRYEDDPAAELESAASPSAWFRDPGTAAGIRS